VVWFLVENYTQLRYHIRALGMMKRVCTCARDVFEVTRVKSRCERVGVRSTRSARKIPDGFGTRPRVDSCLFPFFFSLFFSLRPFLTNFNMDLFHYPPAISFSSWYFTSTLYTRVRASTFMHMQRRMHLCMRIYLRVLPRQQRRRAICRSETAWIIQSNKIISLRNYAINCSAVPFFNRKWT